VRYLQRVSLDGKPLPEGPPLMAEGEAEDSGEGASSPPTWFSGDYAYDSSGNVRSIGQSQSNSDGKANTYVYDTAGRLVSGTVNHQGTHVQTYAYDAYGNMTARQTDGAAALTFPIDAATNRVEGETYDSAGNQSTHAGDVLMFDPVSMMRYKRTVDGAQEFYIYTADDERIGVREGGSRIRWTVRDFGGSVLREFDGPAGLNEGAPGPNYQTETWAWTEDYVYREGQLIAGEREVADGGRRHFHADHLGTARMITRQNGSKIALHDYYAFGVEETDVSQETDVYGHDRPDPKKYTGHERDFSGGTLTRNEHYLDYMHARYYAPSWGRFLSVDPVIDVKRALKSPQMWNRYSYVTNNALNRIDPDGRLVQMVGTDEERKKAFEILKSTLREQDRKHVAMNDKGIVSVASKAKGGVALMMLKDLARKDVPTINVQLGSTVTMKTAPGPSAMKTQDLQVGGGGITVPPAISKSGNMEVHVDPRGSLSVGSPALAVMAHELMGHAWDLFFTGTSSERSAVNTENNILLQLGQQPYQPVPDFP
jgi:RHS repeat-associated protein